MKKTMQIVMVAGSAIIFSLAGQALFAADMMQEGMDSKTIKTMTAKPMTEDTMMPMGKHSMTAAKQDTTDKEGAEMTSDGTTSDMTMEKAKVMKKGMN